jgi:5-formyltetrahydrofolate cyclo-ligase
LHGKQELRHQFRERRRVIPPTVRIEASREAASAAHPWLLAKKPRRVALFVSLKDEIDTQPLYDLLRADGVDVVLPRVRVAETTLDFVLAHDLNDLVPGPFRLLEPRGLAVPRESIDIVVVPGLAFDKSGGRLGYGAGYYDRSLDGYTGATLGFCYRFQLIEEPLPRAGHDRHVSAIACEGGVHEVVA